MTESIDDKFSVLVVEDTSEVKDSIKRVAQHVALYAGGEVYGCERSYKKPSNLDYPGESIDSPMLDVLIHAVRTEKAYASELVA